MALKVAYPLGMCHKFVRRTCGVFGGGTGRAGAAPPAFVRPHPHFPPCQGAAPTRSLFVQTAVMTISGENQRQEPTQKPLLFLSRRHARLLQATAERPRHGGGGQGGKVGGASVMGAETVERRHGEASVKRAVERGQARLAALIQRLV